MLTTVIKHIFSLTILLVSSLAFASNLHSVDQLDGVYTISGVPTNNIQLTCNCNGNKFTVSPAQGSGVNTFSMTAIGTKMFDPAINCPISPDSQNAFRDATNCQFTSTDPRPIVYANVSITELGYHCMAKDAPVGSDCPGQWAVAANFIVQATSDNADYMVTNAAPDDKQPTDIPCTKFACGGQSCCNQWVGQLFKTVPGSVTVTGGPSDLQTVCAQATTNKLSTDPGLIIDLQTQHDLITSGHPETAVTLLCRLSSAGKDYGSLTLQDVNGIRTSTKTVPAHIWSTIVSVATQPSPAVNAKLGVPQFTPDSDVSDNYHNLWTVTLQQAVYPGTLTITGAPTTLTWACTKGLSAYVIASKVSSNDGLTLDFQQTHTQVSPSDPAAIVNAACDFKDSAGNDYGTITLTNLSDANTSMQHPGSTIWAASNITTTQPASVTGYKYTVPAPVAGGDSDPSGTYFNSWSVALYQGVYPGSVTVTGAPVDLIVSCSQGIKKHYNAITGAITIDFQTLHDQYSTDPSVTLNPSCSFRGKTDGLFYGAIAINELNGVRASATHIGSTIWSAKLAINAQPSSQTRYKFAGDPVSSGDSDKQTGTFFTSWMVTLVPS